MLDNVHRVIVAFIYYNTQWNCNIGLLLCFHKHELLPSTLQSLLTASNNWVVSCRLLAVSWVHGTCRNTNMQCDWLVLTGFYTYIFMPVVKYVSMYVDLPYFGKHAWHMIAWVFLDHHALSYPSKTCTLSSLVLYTLHTCHRVFFFLSMSIYECDANHYEKSRKGNWSVYICTIHFSLKCKLLIHVPFTVELRPSKLESLRPIDWMVI